MSKAKKKPKRKLVCPLRHRGKKVRASKGACFVTLASGKKKRVRKVKAASRGAHRQAQNDRADARHQRRLARGSSSCAPLREGSIITGEPIWDASATARFRVVKATNKTAVIEYVSGHNPYYGGQTRGRAKVTCYNGVPGVHVNPGGGARSGITLSGRR